MKRTLVVVFSIFAAFSTASAKDKKATCADQFTKQYEVLITQAMAVLPQSLACDHIVEVRAEKDVKFVSTQAADGETGASQEQFNRWVEDNKHTYTFVVNGVIYINTWQFSKQVDQFRQQFGKSLGYLPKAFAISLAHDAAVLNGATEVQAFEAEKAFAMKLLTSGQIPPSAFDIRQLDEVINLEKSKAAAKPHGDIIASN